MVNIRGHHQRTPSGSPKAEVGEIDTRAPFQSVRAAVSLFGAVATMKGKASLPSFKKSSAPSSESNVLDKETQLMLAQKELSKYKQRLESAETTKSRALTDLERARRTLEELNMKIHSVNESKQAVIATTEAVKQVAKKLEEEKSRDDITNDGAWKEELDHAREQYTIASTELDAAKQYLTKIRQDFDAALEAKLAAFQQASEAQCTAKSHKDKVSELQKEIAAMQESIDQLKHATQRSQQEQAKFIEEKEALSQSYKPAKEEVEEKMLALKSEFHPEQTRNLELQFAEITAEIDFVKEEMKKAHAFEMNAVKIITHELNEATKTLQKVAAKESCLRTTVASLRLELENVKRDSAEAEEKEADMEFIVRNLQAELESSKAELETLSAENSDELISQLHQLTSEAEDAIRSAEEMKKHAEELRQEAETAKTAKEEAEKQLQVALVELEEAKAAEQHAADELRNVSAVCATDFGPGGAKIRMSRKDYEVLSRKNEEADNLAEMKVAAAMFQVGAISASKSDAEQKVETGLKDMEEIQMAIDLALKQAEMSEAAQKAIEGELQRWREQEQYEIVED